MVLVAACLPPRTAPVVPPQPLPPGRMFDSVVAVLQDGYYDPLFVRDNLKILTDEFRPAAVAAATAAEERDVIRRLLTRIPASHLVLLSREEYEDLAYDLAGDRHVMLGMQLVTSQERYFASMVFTGGPAYVAGIRDGDEIAAIDSVTPSQSPYVDWREDDASLPDERDPPTYALHASFGSTLQLRVVRVPGETTTVRVSPGFFSALDATRASVRLTTRDSVRVGYIHWWYMHTRGVAGGFIAALSGPLASSDALLLDLRGRGGSESAVRDVLRMLTPGPEQRFSGPVVALIDRQTRSAKEELAFELRARGLARLVGEPTAGAFIPAGFARITRDAVLMYPVTDKVPNPYTPLIEQHPVPPDVAAPSIGPYAGGVDSLVEAGLAEATRLVRERGAGVTLPPTIEVLVTRMIAAYGGESTFELFDAVTGSGTSRTRRIQQDSITPVDSPATLDSPVALGGVNLRWQALYDLPRQSVMDRDAAKVQGLELFDGEPCVRVRVGTTKAAVDLFVALRTFLARGARFMVHKEKGTATTWVYYRSYRSVAGLMVPDTIEVEVGDEAAELRLDRIRVL